jgi:predicted nucleic acid-binding protein
LRLAFDTSVLVAALVEAHEFHPRATRWIEEAVSGRNEATCSWHAAAETWSVLTRIPLDPPISPPLAEVAIDRLLTYIEPVALTAEHYRLALRRCAERGVRSGAVFDALHLICAEARRAEGLVTFNPADFERLRGAASPPILVPPDPPAFTVPHG